MDNMTEDEKKAIADAVAEATAALKIEHEEAIKGLKSKNAELIASQKKAKDDADAAEAAKEAAEAKAAETSTDVEAVRTALEKKHTRELKAANDERDAAIKDRDTAFGQRDKLMIDGVLKEELVKAGVPQEQVGLVYRAMRNEAKVEGDNVVMNGLTIPEFVADWSTSDEGKHFVTVPVTTGAGVTAVTTGTGKTHDFTKENIDARMGDWLVLASKDEAKAKSVAIEIGRPDLAK